MSDREERLARLGEEVEALLAAGTELDVPALAQRFDLPPEDVEDCVAALAALGGATLDDDPPGDVPPPHLPPDYELIDEIGRGGMGVVYRARQRSLDRTVAVKVLRPGDLMFGEALRRFEKEAQSLARLRHPHIVSVHEVGRAGGHVWFSMDYVDGESLAARIRRGLMTPSEAARILGQVADAIAYTHSRGIVHRDLKPENILIDRAGDAYVVDFGLARDMAVTSGLTLSGRILGTPAYMSPEQALGDAARIGEATDVWALGAILYECLTGTSPFGGRPLADQIHAVIHEDPVRPAKRNPRVPKPLEAICLKALAKDPRRRYQTAKALGEDLAAFAAGRRVTARTPGPLRRMWWIGVRHKSTIFAGATVAAVLLLLFLTLVQPLIGRTPENRYATAVELTQEGEPGAAAVLLEGVIEELSDLPVPRRRDRELPTDLLGRAQRQLAVARMRQAEKLAAAGRLDEALALQEQAWKEGDRAFPRHAWPEKPDLLLGHSIALARAHRYPEAEKTWWKLADDLRNGSGQLGVEDLLHSDPFARAEKGIRSRLARRFASASSGERDGVVYISLLMACQPGIPDSGPGWLPSLGRDAVPLLVEMIRLLDVLDEERVDRFEHSLVNVARGLAYTELRPALEAALAGILEDESAPEVSRGEALYLFLAVADLPGSTMVQGEGVGANWLPEVARRALALWRETKDLPPFEAWRRKVVSEIEEGDPGRPYQDPRWLREHIGAERLVRRSTEEWQQWLDECRDEDPRWWIARELGLESIDPVDVFRSYEKSRDRRYAHHLLLTFAVSSGPEKPVWLWDSPEPPDLGATWRRLVRPPQDTPPHLVRVAGFLVEDGEAEPRLLWEETRILEAGQPVPIEHRGARLADWAVQWRPPGLGTRAAAGPFRHEYFQVGANLVWVGDLLHVSFGSYSERTVGAGGGSTRAWGGGGRSWPVSFVMDPTVSAPIEWDRRPGNTVTDFVLAVALEDTSDRAPWTVADWRRQIRSNLRFLGANWKPDPPPRTPLRDEFATKYYNALWLLPQILAHLGLPDGGDALRSITYEDDVHATLASWYPARITAGDETVLDLPDFDRKLRYYEDQYRLGPGWWTRVATTTKCDRIRKLAWSRLLEGDLPDGPAATIERAIDERGLDAPEEIRERVAGAASRYAWNRRGDVNAFLIAGALLALFTLVVFVFALRGRPIAAALLVLAGLAIIGLDIYRYGHDLLPDVVGFVLAALGAWLLARRAAGRCARVPASAFAFAAVMDFTPYLFLSGAAVAVGVLFLPVLAARLTPGRRRVRHPIFLLCYGVPAAVIWVGAASAWLSGRPGFTISKDLFHAMVAAAAFAVLWACLRLLGAASALRRSTPPA